MSLNNYNFIPNINQHYKLSQKSTNKKSLSPNMKPLHSQTKKIQNNLFPKSNNASNIKVNVIHLKKEKIIEGDLNFEEDNKKKYYLKKNFINTNKQRKRMPNKSPIPIRGGYNSKDIFNFDRVFGSNNKFPNEQKYNQNLINNYIFINNNNHFSKTFNSFYKKGERSHTPIIKSNNNQAFMNLGNNNKLGNKFRRITKSPNKSFNFKKNDNFGFGLSSNFHNDKKYKYVNNFNNKGIKGDIHKEYFWNNNYNNNNIKLKNNINVVNLRPTSHNNFINNNKNKINLYDEEINMNILKQNNKKEKNKENIFNNTNNDKTSNIPKKKARPNSPKNNPNKYSFRNNLKNNHIVISDNNIEKIKEEENKNKELTSVKEEKPKKIIRSHSQTPLDPLKQKEDLPPKKPQEKIGEENNNKTPKKKIIKKIRDIYEYTHVGFDGEEPKENNQDKSFIYKNFAEHKDYIYLSVCDGHGVEGHFVSDFIKDVLPYYMSENLKNTNILTERELTHQIIVETFLLVNNMLVANENINSLFSGSTCVSVIYTPEKLIVPNIGDSRAVLGRYDKITNTYKAIELSRDHKPTEKDESKRIYDNDGRIQPFTEEGEFVGPQRVWLKDEEVPGLAMTRSFGDRVASMVGVISEPEIKEFDFDEGDKFMIIASDGIWEFISSQECVNIIKDFYEKNDMKGCADFLYEESSKRWLKEEEVIDDTTLILVFFD